MLSDVIRYEAKPISLDFLARATVYIDESQFRFPSVVELSNGFGGAATN
jgi:hypothetical protein